MKNPLMFTIILLFLIYPAYLFYLSWFRSEKYIEHSKRTQKRVKKYLPFYPEGMIDFANFYGNAKIQIYWARIGTSIVILMGIIGLIAAVWSPYVK